uniref:Peptidase S1 domain-containing protein n=1 Tax=Anopheles dirus TaxID=7168 RepID=A0A182NCN1_9DIPT
MFLVRRLLVLVFVWCALPEVSGKEQRLICGRRRVDTVFLINNGINAIAGHWPWHAAIFHRKLGQLEYACGGSILDQRTVLTAAHCVTTPHGMISLRLISVHVGQTHLREESEYIQVHGVQEVIVHPSFIVHSIPYDIALIKLTANIALSKFVQPVCLWTMDDQLESIVGKNGTIIGFGLTERDVTSDHLKQALVSVVDPLSCIESDRAAFGTLLTKEMFCGKGQPGVSACNGDSGGGMFFEIGGKWFVRGLVSFTPVRAGTSLCDNLKHTAFTDVAKYSEWISKYVDPRVLPTDSDGIEVNYEEKQRLFNFDTCGIYSYEIFLPWLGMLTSPTADGTFGQRCAVTLISDWYAVGPAHCFRNDGLK